ncbi:sigma-54 interaction domain-containing protein [Desulfothermus sp.]
MREDKEYQHIKRLILLLIKITEAISKGSYDEAQKLFELTKEDKYPEEITSLAESFGLMLVKVEAREFHLKEIIKELEKAKAELEIARQKLALENKDLKQTIKGTFTPKRIIGQSRIMQQIFAQCERLADLPVNVLITGETGTGKELVAKTLHYNGIRRDGPFVAINCTAIPESLFESELFGIEKGVATGVTKRIGRIEQADGGTLFLDEIGDMPLSAQAKILRVLEEGEIVRIGGKKAIPLDIRVIAATNKDLKDEIKKGNFREDLYFRIKVVNIHLPPLRDRKDDIPLLLNTFLKIYCSKFGRENMKFSEKAMHYLKNYSWPGNVRELENEVERVVALAPFNVIRPEDLSEEITSSIKDYMPEYRDIIPLENEIFNLQEMEKIIIKKALLKTNNNKSKAAKLLGITREGLRKKLARYRFS